MQQRTTPYRVKRSQPGSGVQVPHLDGGVRTAGDQRVLVRLGGRYTKLFSLQKNLEKCYYFH